MNNEKYIKRDLLYSYIFIAVGAIAAITGYLFDYHKNLMSGITFGFLPTGLGMAIIYIFIKKKPDMQKNIELENEERNIFINTKAGHTAFWISYWYIFAAIILNNILTIPILTFLIVTLIFMPVVYFTITIIYHKTY